jgi:2'-5' RNA ligase
MKTEDKLVRTFLAIPTPKSVGIKKNMLFSTIDEKSTVNWVKNENLHVTLKYLGYTKESKFPKLLEDIKNIVINTNPFNLMINGTGCFPNKERAKILWLGLEGNQGPLFNLFSNFENLFESYGFPKETLVFKPHITIARIKYPQKFEPNLNTFLNSRFDPIEFPVNRVQFLTSELLPSGVVYTLIKSFPLGEE